MVDNFKNELFQWLGAWEQAAEARIALMKNLRYLVGFI
jgi:hypothetical protein